MSFRWDSVYSVFARTRNYLVDPPGEENPENPELAITGEWRGATINVFKRGSGQMVSPPPTFSHVIFRYILDELAKHFTEVQRHFSSDSRL